MNPLFSIVFFALIVTAVTVLAFLIALIFQPPKWAIHTALVFIVGVLGGVAAAAALSLLIVAVGAILNSPFQGYFYLTTLFIGGLIGGVLSLWIRIRPRLADPSLKRDWLKPGS